jgi:hypothetical protein
MELLPLLVTNRLILLSVIGVITFLFFVYKKWKYIVETWDGFMFWNMNFFYRWPLIGRMSSHKKSLHLNTENGWYDGERKLCEDFYPRYKRYASYTEKDYINCKNYLAKAGETGRNPRPLWMWIVLIAFVVGEAAIFSKLILSFAGELSNNDIKWVSWVIAFLLAMVLLFLTEKTGHELYVNTLIKKVKIWHNDDAKSEYKIPRPNLKVSLLNNDLDDNDPDYQQILNRLNGVNVELKPMYAWGIGTAIVVAIIAVIAFIERSALNSDMIETSEIGAYSSYLFYSVVFLAIQAMGVGFAYLYSFASKEGEIAWNLSHKFVSVDDYLKWPHRKADKIAEVAQDRLGHLQKFILKKAPSDEINLAQMHKRTFRAYATQEKV